MQFPAQARARFATDNQADPTQRVSESQRATCRASCQRGQGFGEDAAPALRIAAEKLARLHFQTHR